MRVLPGAAWLLLLLGVGSCGSDGDGGSAYQARYDVTIQSAAARRLSKGMLWLSLPTTSSADVDVPSDPDARLIGDNLGNRQLSFELNEVPVGYRRALSITLTLPPAADTPASEPPGGTFRSAEPLIESDDPALQEKARSLQSFGAPQTVEAVRDYVMNLQPPSGPAGEGPDEPRQEPENGSPDDMAAGEQRRGALAAFQSGAGEQADRVLLTVALLRAASIPARVVAGFLDNGDGVLTSNEMQLWAEYLDQAVWQPVLPAGAGAETRAIVFRIFPRADEVSAESMVQNFFQGVGLKITVGS